MGHRIPNSRSLYISIDFVSATLIVFTFGYAVVSWLSPDDEVFRATEFSSPRACKVEFISFLQHSLIVHVTSDFVVSS